MRAQARGERNERILGLIAQGYRNKTIARELGLDVKTVRRVRRGAKKRKGRGSKLDPFKAVVRELAQLRRS